METVILRTNPRKDNTGLKITYEVIGSGASGEAMRQAIRGLENYPARAERRALVDVLGLIEAGRYQVCHVEHGPDPDAEGVEYWLFLLQR
ncbi:MAG: hypothetical protein H6988_08360 [Pseudomonadales bacterium]|nr:hypothetical protein [Anaerolineales bacterium]MCB8917686.1 hypothetical protein [Ardenticatenaceae bacterium]MCP5190390.1 hypothetical protein [Pseudomonadales bacterium]